MAFVASVLWMIPVTVLLLVFAGLFAVVEGVKNSPLWPNRRDDDDCD